MTKAPLCRFCKVRHYGNCNKGFDRAINTAINTPARALATTSRVGRGGSVVEHDGADVSDVSVSPLRGEKGRTGNRRDREVYNEYMKGYMARRRANG